MLRRIKLLYSIYNFFHRNRLKHNVALYKKLGLDKRYYSSISSKDFLHLDEKILHVDTPPIETTALFQEAEEETKKSILGFEEKGFLILKNYLSEQVVDAVNLEIDNLLRKKRVKFVNRNKIMFAIHQSALLNDIGTKHKLCQFLSSLMKGNAKLFQSINFLHGSEQETHSDSIHMTTFPSGGLLGVWVALEDIGLDNGPLHYFPESHKLPYYLNPDYENEGNAFLLGHKDYAEYEKMIAEKVQENNLQKTIFFAKKGDVLIWHANLLHGGEAHIDKSKTRKSMVFHYFNTNCICYHEITQRPALFSSR